MIPIIVFTDIFIQPSFMSTESGMNQTRPSPYPPEYQKQIKKYSYIKDGITQESPDIIE